MSAPLASVVLLVALCTAASVIIRHWEARFRGRWWRGAVFGAVAAVVLFFPESNGIHASLNGQTVAIGLAGLYFGPAAAALSAGAACICALAGLESGLSDCLISIVLAAVVGGAGFYWWRGSASPRSLVHAGVLSFVTHGGLVLLFVPFPPDAGPLDMDAYARALFLYPAAMVLSAAALNDQRNLALRAQRFHDVFDQQFQFMAILSPEGRLLEINDLPLRAAGGEREDVLGAYFWDTPWWRNLPEMRANWPIRLREAAAADGPVFSLDQFQDLSGAIHIADAMISAVKDRHGAVQHFIIQASDVTDRLKAEEELRQRENLLRIAGHAARVGGWTLNLKNDQVTWSEEIYRIRELPVEYEPSKASVLEAYLPESRALLREAVSACIAAGTPYDLSLELKTGQGRQIHVRAIGEAVRDDTGTIIALQGALQDISDAVEANRALRDVTNRLKGILDFSPIFIAVFDRDGRYLLANRAHEKLTGWRLEGRTLDEALPPKNAKHYYDVIEAVVRQREAQTLEDYIEINGVPHFLTGVLFPLVDSDGEVTSIGGIAIDVTDEKEAEAERKNLTAQLHQAQKMDAVGRLAGGVAHDFNNMLGVILGYVEMALGKLGEDDPIRADLTEVRKAAIRSTDLTRQLLAFARRQTIAPKVLQLNFVVESMLKMLSRLIGEQIDLLWKPGSDMWPVYIDPTQVDQVLANLAVNARDAIGEAGKLTIETAVAEFDEAYCAQHPGFVPGRYAMLAVSDDGCGMTPEVREQVFEPFFTTKPASEGTGLGLATVYGIVKQNGGFINIYSEPGEGTTVRIYFPSSDASFNSAAAEVKTASAPGGDETILLVEDEPALLALGTRQLELLGYQVLAAATPPEALEIAASYSDHIHLLMTDVIMPEMDGKELWRRLDALRPGIRTLYVSGYTADTIAHRGVLDEGVHFLQKPFTTKSVASKIREVLEEEAAG